MSKQFIDRAALELLVAEEMARYLALEGRALEEKNTNAEMINWGARKALEFLSYRFDRLTIVTKDEGAA